MRRETVREGRRGRRGTGFDDPRVAPQSHGRGTDTPAAAGLDSAAGGMVLDPLAGFICFVLSGGLALLGAVRNKGRIRYVSMIVLVVSLALAFSKAPDALRHYQAYLYEKVDPVK